MRTQRTAAWLLLALTLASAVGSAVLHSDDWPLIAIAPLGAILTFVAVLGTLIVDRRSGNAVGWILLAIGFLLAAGLFATQWAEQALVTDPGSLPGGRTAAWLQSWLWTPLIGAIPLLVLLFPTGRPPSRRWTIVAWIALALVATMLTTAAFRPGVYDTFPQHVNPFGIMTIARLRAATDPLATPVLAACTVAAVASLVIRMRRSRGVERQQIKWFVYAVVTATGLTLVNPIANMTSAPSELVHFVMAFFMPLLGLLLLPVAIAASVLRFRLYDIDRLISRTVSYAIVTAIIVGMYALMAVVLPSRLFAGRNTPDAAIAAGTLLAAGAFGPVRRRVQARVDRRFNRARYDTAHTIEAFSGRLREQVDIDALGTELREVITRTMHPVHVSLWVKP